MNIIKYIASQFVDFFFPPRCPFCNKVVEPETELCSDCERRVFNETLTGEVGSMFCTAHRNIGKLDLLISNYKYTGRVADGIILLKSDERFCAAGYFADKLAVQVRNYYIDKIADLVTYVPPHRSKRDRSLSERLAKLVSLRTGIRCEGLLVKTRATKSQHTLSSGERRRNLVGAFELKNGTDLTGKIVLIVDDVVTTGSTLNECAAMLKKNGHAAAVFAVTIAAAPVKRYKRVTHKKAVPTHA